MAYALLRRNIGNNLMLFADIEKLKLEVVPKKLALASIAKYPEQFINCKIANKKLEVPYAWECILRKRTGNIALARICVDSKAQEMFQVVRKNYSSEKGRNGSSLYYTVLGFDINNMELFLSDDYRDIYDSDMAAEPIKLTPTEIQQVMSNVCEELPQSSNETKSTELLNTISGALHLSNDTKGDVTAKEVYEALREWRMEDLVWSIKQQGGSVTKMNHEVTRNDGERAIDGSRYIVSLDTGTVILGPDMVKKSSTEDDKWLISSNGGIRIIAAAELLTNPPSEYERDENIRVSGPCEVDIVGCGWGVKSEEHIEDVDNASRVGVWYCLDKAKADGGNPNISISLNAYCTNANEIHIDADDEATCAFARVLVKTESKNRRGDSSPNNTNKTLDMEAIGDTREYSVSDSSKNIMIAKPSVGGHKFAISGGRLTQTQIAEWQVVKISEHTLDKSLDIKADRVGIDRLNMYENNGIPTLSITADNIDTLETRGKGDVNVITRKIVSLAAGGKNIVISTPDNAALEAEDIRNMGCYDGGWGDTWDSITFKCNGIKIGGIDKAFYQRYAMDKDKTPPRFTASPETKKDILDAIAKSTCTEYNNHRLIKELEEYMLLSATSGEAGVVDMMGRRLPGSALVSNGKLDTSKLKNIKNVQIELGGIEGVSSLQELKEWMGDEQKTLIDANMYDWDLGGELTFNSIGKVRFAGNIVILPKECRKIDLAIQMATADIVVTQEDEIEGFGTTLAGWSYANTSGYGYLSPRRSSMQIHCIGKSKMGKFLRRRRAELSNRFTVVEYESREELEEKYHLVVKNSLRVQMIMSGGGKSLGQLDEESRLRSRGLMIMSEFENSEFDTPDGIRVDASDDSYSVVEVPEKCEYKLNLIRNRLSHFSWHDDLVGIIAGIDRQGQFKIKIGKYTVEYTSYVPDELNESGCKDCLLVRVFNEDTGKLVDGGLIDVVQDGMYGHEGKLLIGGNEAIIGGKWKATTNVPYKYRRGEKWLVPENIKELTTLRLCEIANSAIFFMGSESVYPMVLRDFESINKYRVGKVLRETVNFGLAETAEAFVQKGIPFPCSREQQAAFLLAKNGIHKYYKGETVFNAEMFLMKYEFYKGLSDVESMTVEQLKELQENVALLKRKEAKERTWDTEFTHEIEITGEDRKVKLIHESNPNATSQVRERDILVDNGVEYLMHHFMYWNRQ